MLNLSELVFKVNTEALVDAANKVAALGKSVDGLSSTFSKLEKSSSQASKAQAKAEKDLAAAEVDRAKAAEIAARTEERKSKAVRDTTKATEEATVATKSSVSILERQQTILEFQANGYSKGQASILAYAKAAGVAASEIQEIGKVLQAQRTLMGGDPFDKSLGSLKSLQNEFKTLKEVQRLYTAEIPLTRKQMENLALDKLRLIEAMKIEGRSMSDMKAAIKTLNVEYITTAQNINRVTQAENELDKARKDSANANAFLEKEMQRVNFALQAQNNELNKGTANALNRFEQNLKRSGLTLDQQRVKMEEYRKGLLALEKTKGGNTDYITRALGPQITDIFVGLATGQSPLTVMLQQGGQLRDQFALAGVAAADMGKTMRTAAKDMVVSVAGVAKAFGDLLLGSFIDTGKGIVNLIGNVTGLNKVLEYARYQLTLFAMTDPSFGGPLLKLFNGLRVAVIGFAATMAATGVGALIAMAVALKQVISENDTLAKSLALSGGALGISQSSAIEYVKSLGEVGVTTGKATEAIAEMAKAGVFAKEDILLVGKAAADMATYAGIGVDDTVKQFAKLKEKPVEALFDIAKATGMVPPEILKMVIELEKSGKSADAAALAMKTYADVTKKQVAQMKETYNGFSLFMIELGDKISGFFSRVFKNLFLASNPTTELEKQLKNTQTLINQYKGAAAYSPDNALGNQVKLLETQARMISSQISAQVRLTQAKEQETVALAENGRIEAAKFKMFESTEDKLDKNLKQTKTLGEWQAFYIDKQIEKLAKEANVNKDRIKLTDEEIEKTKELAKVEWDRANKKKSGNQTASATLDIDRSNEIRLLEQQFEREASLRQKFMDDQMKVMKADYEMGYITKAEYLDKETALLRSTLTQQRADSEAVIKQREALYLQETQTLINAYNERVKANKGLKNSDEADVRALEKLQVALMNSGREYENFIDKVKSKDSALASSLTAKEVEAMKVLYENVKKNNEAYAEYIRNNELRIQQRKEDIATADALRWATPEQAAVIKAVADEVKHYGAELSKFQRIAKKAKETMDDTIGRFGVMSPQAQVAIKQYNTSMDRVNQVVADERVAKEQAATDAILEYYKNEYKRISDGITDSIVTALFEGGKAGAKKFREVIVNVLRQKVTIVVDAVVNTLLGNVIGSLLGGLGGGGSGGAAAGGVGNLLSLGSNAYSLYSGGFGGTVVGQLYSGYTGATLAPGMVGPSATAITPASQVGNAFGTGFQGSSGTLAGAGVFAAVVAVVLNALGAFASERKVGSGIRGTLGKGNITPWEEWREGGTLFSGPEYTTMNPIEELIKARKRLKELQEASLRGEVGNPQALATQETIVDKLDAEYGDMADQMEKQSKAIQSAFDTMKTNVIDMAKVLGLNTDALKDFTTQLGGSDKGLNFEGLSDAEIQAKITEALATANNELAQQVIGSWETTTKRVIEEIIGSGEDAITIYTEVEDTITRTRYIASEYAKVGEKAIDTLTRLATSLGTVNQVFDTLGYKAYEASLKGGDMASKLADLFGGLDKFVAATTVYYQNFYSESERQATALRQLDKEFKAHNLTLPKTREEYRKLVESQDLTTEEGRKMYAWLIQLAPAFAEISQSAADIADAAKNKLRDALEAAYSALEKAVQAQIDILKEQETAQTAVVNNLKSIFDLLSKNVKELYQQVDSTSGMLASQGRAVISNALSTGNLPDISTLTDAISAVRSEVEGASYTTQFEADKARLQLAADLQSLADKTADQLSTEELILKAIKDQVKYYENLLIEARNQIDAILGVQNAVLTVAEALDALKKLMFPEIGTLKPEKVGGSSSGDGFAVGGGTAGGATKAAKPGTKDANGRYYVEQFYGPFGSNLQSASDVEQARLTSLESTYTQITQAAQAGGNLGSWFQGLKDSGMTLQEAAALAGYYYEDMAQAAIDTGVGVFANGGAFTNGVVSKPTSFNMGVMGEAGPEAIMPLTNVGGQLGVAAVSSGTDTALVERISNLEFALQAIALNTSKMARIFDAAQGEDGRSIMTSAAPV